MARSSRQPSVRPPDAAGEAPPPALAAVIVNHDAGDVLLRCVASLRADHVGEVVVVDNASTDGSPDALVAADPDARLVRAGANLGYGAGANRGIEATGGELVLVMNADVAVHRGAVDSMVAELASHPAWAVVGPRILEADGTHYPSARRFPSMADAAGHAVLAGLAPANRFTRRYRMADLSAEVTTEVDWVSGACFLARRRALEDLGGFDEAYFMYAEDVDLCWRARRAGWGVAYVPAAVVTHIQGLSTARRPFRMLVAHHRSVLRFAARTARGWRRALLPAVAVVLGLRLLVTSARTAVDALRSSPRRAE